MLGKPSVVDGGLPFLGCTVASIRPADGGVSGGETMKKIIGLLILVLTGSLAISFADPGPGKLLVILGIVVSLGGLFIMVRLVKFFWYP